MIIEAINDLNWVAIAVSVGASFVLGSIWFTPAVFGRYWARQVERYSGTTELEITNEASRPDRLLRWIVAMLVNVIALALVIENLRADSVAEGMVLGAVLSFGFGSTLGSWPPIFARMPWGWWWVNNGAFLVMQIAAGSVLAVWQ